MNRNLVWLSMRLATVILVVAGHIATAALSDEGGTSEVTAPYRTWQMPGTSLASPGGFGAQWGQVFVGGGYQSASRGTTVSDGAIGAGFGLGNAQKYVGLQVSASIFDVSKFKDGSVDFKLHRVLPAGFGVALGTEGILSFGTANTFNGKTTNGIDPRDRSYYGSVSKIFFMREENKWFSALTLTGGIGNGRFRSVDNRNADVSGVNFFGSAAIRVRQPIALIGDWSGQSLNVGASITPIRTFPLFINPVLADVAGISGQSARFTLGVGMAFTFSS